MKAKNVPRGFGMALRVKPGRFEDSMRAQASVRPGVLEPLQEPLASRAPGEWWARMEKVFHHD
jgi:L-rhamnose mutarotase